MKKLSQRRPSLPEETSAHLVFRCDVLLMVQSSSAVHANKPSTAHMLKVVHHGDASRFFHRSLHLDIHDLHKLVVLIQVAHLGPQRKALFAIRANKRVLRAPRRGRRTMKAAFATTRITKLHAQERRHGKKMSPSAEHLMDAVPFA